MNYQGDIALGETLDVKFTTVSTTGVPTTLAGSPAVAAYVDNSTTEITAGITLSVDFDSRTGLHNVRVVASSGNGFATATNVNLIITAGTVSSNSVVGYVIGSFSIEKRSGLRSTVAGRTLDVTATGEAGIDLDNTSGTLAKGTDITGFNDISTANVQTELTTYGALKPTTAGRTLDITTTGEAGIDWANIGAPTTTVNLSGTTIKNTTDVSAYIDTEVGAIKTVTDKLDTAMEIDGAVYRFTQNALEMAPSAGLQGNGGTLRFDDVWKWTTAGSVSSGQIRGNVTDWNTITQLWIHTVTNGGINLGAYLRVLTTNDTIRVQQENSVAVWNSYIVTGTITDNTTWISVPVALRTGASVSPPSTATNCLVSFFRPNAQDWTDTEKSQIRYRVGIDGTTATPSATPTLALQATSTSIKTVTDKLDTAMVVDGAVYQYTANALELGPAGGGGGGDASQATLLAVKAKTDNLPTDPADASDIAASFTTVNTKLDTITTGLPLDTTELNAIADALLKRDWNSVTGEAAHSALNAFRMLRNVWNTTAGTLTVKKEDGTTTAWTRTLSVDPTAQPIVGAS